LKSASTVFQAVITDSMTLNRPYLALNNPRFDPEAFPARQRFLRRRIKLLRNILLWRKYTGEKYGIGELAVRLVSGIIVPIAETGWDIGGQEAVREVKFYARLYCQTFLTFVSQAAALLPSELVPPSVKAKMSSF
jgi:GC-rich sequence DNA-binding factor